MIILGFTAASIFAFALGNKLFKNYRNDSYEQNTNSCSIIDYEIAEKLSKR